MMIRMLFGILGKSLLANQLTLQLVKGPSIELLLDIYAIRLSRIKTDALSVSDHDAASQ